MSALFDQQNPYGGQSYGYGSEQTGGNASNLQFYSSGNTAAGYDTYSSSGAMRSSLEGNMSGYGSSNADRSIINSQMGFWSAFGTGGFPDEPSLMEGT